MKVKSAIAFLFLSSMTGLPVRLGGQAITRFSENVLEGMPKDLEIRLALSALPPYLRSDATVYILDPAKGYTAEQKGTSDFTCFVERTDWVRADFCNDLFIPQCFDAEATRAIVPVSFDVARLRAEGKLTCEQLRRKFRGDSRMAHTVRRRGQESLTCCPSSRGCTGGLPQERFDSSICRTICFMPRI